MKINNRKILIFPEYHLTDFPPQTPLTRQQAHDILAAYKKQGLDLLVSGYVEQEEDRLYSSCLVIDGPNTYNIRKDFPYKDEADFISPSPEKRNPVDLSIGLTLFVICHDYSFLLRGAYQQLVETHDIENFILISAMFENFQENTEKCISYCRKNRIKRFISSDRFFGLNATDVMV